MSAHLYSCSRCPRRFDSIEECIEHKEDAHSDELRADGGELALDEEPQYRVSYYSGGYQFTSEPLPLEAASEYAKKMKDVVVRCDLGERPLIDDDNVDLIPVRGGADE